MADNSSNNVRLCSASRGHGGHTDLPLSSLPMGICVPQMANKALGKDSLLQRGNRIEDLQSTESQVMAVAVIQTSLVQVNPPEAPEPRECKHVHRPPTLEVSAVLATVDFCSLRHVA
jgi:hypothetical protein